MAVLLSFLCPGLGHLYLGRLVQAMLFFVLAVIGYVAFIVPGVLIHLFAMIDAGREAGRQRERQMERQAELMARAVHGARR